MPGRRRSPSGTSRYDQSDPLLYIESLPYWETRGYVPIILRNYWIYEDRGGDRSPEPPRARRRACGRASPACPAPSAVRIEPPRRATAATGSATELICSCICSA